MCLGFNRSLAAGNYKMGDEVKVVVWSSKEEWWELLQSQASIHAPNKQILRLEGARAKLVRHVHVAA
jgi:hypothetical protein